jgi:hypothetical protein
MFALRSSALLFHNAQKRQEMAQDSEIVSENGGDEAGYCPG